MVERPFVTLLFATTGYWTHNFRLFGRADIRRRFDILGIPQTVSLACIARNGIDIVLVVG